MIGEHRRPDQIAVALDDRVRRAMLARFVGIERRVDAAEHDRRAALAREAAEVIPAQRVRRVDADADHVARRDALEVERLERFVDDHRRAVVGGRGRGKHVQPARRDDGGPERDVRGIDEVYAH